MNFPVYYALDVGSVGLLAFAGGYRGLTQGLPLAGSLVLAALAGLSGILVRDVLLGFGAIAPLHDPAYAAAAFLGALLGALCALWHVRRRRTFLTWCFGVADSAGMTVAAAMGASRGDVVGLAPVGCVLLGLLAGCVPGVVRDLCVGDVPQAFEKQFYATACFIAAMASLGLGHIFMTGNHVVLGAAFIGLWLRLWGIQRDMHY